MRSNRGFVLAALSLVSTLAVGCGSDDGASPDPEGASGGGGMGAASGSGGVSAGGASGASGASGSGGTATGGAAGAGGMAAGGASGSGGGGSAGATTDGGPGAHRFDIRFDYRFDKVGFFSAPERRAALEAAGAAWSKVIQEDFDTIPKGTRLRLRNPENRDEYVWVEGIEDDIDDVLVFVGTSEAIAGLGRGGSAGTAVPVDPALDDALVLRRDGADYEPWAGSISFKASSDWYFDPTPETSTDIPFKQYDFISLATHELGHVLGFTDADAFTALVVSGAFTGPRAVASYGAPVPLSTDLIHLLKGTQSQGREAIMGPSLTNGIRQTPTPLDAAMLADIGYLIATP